MRSFSVVMCLACAVLVSWKSFAQVKPDLLLFDDGDHATYHDASWGNVTSPSALTLGGGGDKLVVDASQHSTGARSGKVEWKSAAGGDWKIFIASTGWTAVNAAGYDTLLFFVNARAAIPAAQLPTLGLETSTSTLSTLIALDAYLPSGIDGDTTSWQRVAIPLARFSGFDFSKLKDVNFHQGASDAQLHTMWVDDIRVTAKPSAADTVKPAAPAHVVTRYGDRSITLHWDLNTDSSTSAYRVYRGTSASGPFAQVSASRVEIASFADCAVDNGTAYLYYVAAVNANGLAGASSDTVSVTPHVFASNDEFLDYVARTSFDYFWYEANPKNGLIKDRSTSGSACSIASVGFGLTAIGIAVDRGWITREEGARRTLTTLTTFSQGPQSILATNMIGYKGWFYHFLDMKTAVRSGTSELSSIDTGLLLAGILYSKQYFAGSDSAESEIRALADSIFNRVDWTWMCNGGTSLTMGWNPGSGFITSRWIGYNEAMILYIMGLGAKTNPLTTLSWSAWTGGYRWNYNQWLKDSFVDFAPLFGHQYSHCWVDFRGIADSYMKTKGITYFENSRRATLAQRLYCIANPRGATGYGPNLWGITASDVPTGYAARGTNDNDDGTLNATAPGGSMPFAPEYCLPALRAMYDSYRPTIWTGYGFCDAFNLSVSPAWWDAAVLGIDQGPIVIMAENYRTAGVWNMFMKEKIIADGLKRAGFEPVTDVAEGKASITPHEFALTQNYPNPFNPTTTIRYTIPRDGHVRLTITNVLGQTVAELVNAFERAGEHTVAYRAPEHGASGIYFYTVRTGGVSLTKKMIQLN